MNLKGFVLDVSMVVVCYLVISIPMVIATNVNIIYDGGNAGSAQYNPGDYVRVNGVAYDSGIPSIWKDQDIRVDFVVGNNTNDVVIESGYVYQCGDLDPDACVDSVPPEAFSVKFEETYNWIDIRDADSPSHNEISNFVVFARAVKSGKSFWTGFHYQVRRSSYNLFYGVSDDISGIDVHAKDYGSVNSILNFIQESIMIPFNPAWVDKVIFQGVDYIFEMGSDSPPSFETGMSGVDEVSGLGYDYGFVFSNDSSGVYNAIVLNVNPSYTCGSGVCDTGLGENSVNCCLDCGCIGGYYCDAVGGCRNENSITLGLSGTQTIHMSNCYQEHQAEVYVKVNNAPSDMVISSSYYSLAGSSQGTACSPVGGGVYSCLITVPPVPDCGTGTQSIGPNSITLDIAYSDGLVQKSKTMSTPFPDVTVGSFDCGDGSCQEDLGENPANCCYDCGCGFGYCDIGSLETRDSGSCRSGLGDSSLQVIFDKTSLGSHGVGGDSLGLDLRVANAPSSLELSGEDCTLDCRRSDGVSCSASCSMSCSAGSSGVGDYEKRCSMDFSVSDYYSYVDYTLTPEVRSSAGYYDGPDYTIESLSKTALPIHIGANWCGDDVCAGGDVETPDNCCYDCGCPGEMYCDNMDANAPSEGDSCRSLEGIGLVVVDSGPYSFSDSAVQNMIDLSVEITNKPSGLAVDPECEISGGDVRCHVECKGTESTYPDVYNMACSLTISPVNYKNPSVSDGYDPVEHKLELSGNSVEFALRFNDGYGSAGKVFAEPLQDIVMDVIWHCGNDVCETELEESSGNCCIDCPCEQEDDFCHTFNTLHGECLDRSEIQVGDVKIEPVPMVCTIELGARDMCIFTSPRADAEILIDSLPVGAEVVDSSYSISGMECRTNSTECPTYCGLNQNSTGYVCHILIPPIESGVEEEVILDVGFHLTVQHPANFSTGLMFTEDFAFTGTLIVSKENSEELKNCIDMDKDMEKKESKNDLITAIVWTFLGLVYALTVVAIIMWILVELKKKDPKLPCCVDSDCAWSLFSTCESFALNGLKISSCLSSALLPLLGSLEEQIAKMKLEYANMCAAEDLESLQEATDDMGSLWYNVAGGVMGAVCMYMVMGGDFGLSSGSSSGGGGTGGGGTGGVMPTTTQASPVSPTITDYGGGAEPLFGDGGPAP
jgi:hypothetical protein